MLGQVALVGSSIGACTVKICESGQVYVPLNDGYNRKGDPNATLSGQDASSAKTVP